MKHDMQRQTTEVHDYGRGRMTSEPVFVRKPGATAEDDGWIALLVVERLIVMGAMERRADPSGPTPSDR